VALVELSRSLYTLVCFSDVHIKLLAHTILSGDGDELINAPWGEGAMYDSLYLASEIR
jgi:hypothetical protein